MLKSGAGAPRAALPHGFFFPFEYGDYRAAHGRFRRTLARPDFILRETLREKHFNPGYGLDASPAGDPQQFGRPRTIDHIHHQSAIQVRAPERRSAVWMHTDGGAIHDRVEKLPAKICKRHNLSPDGARQGSGALGSPRRQANDGPGVCQSESSGSRRPSGSDQ